MEKPLFVKNITIEKVRHLQNIQISVSDDTLKHLIITGKNGSGKTSLLEAMSGYLKSITTSNDPMAAEESLRTDLNNLESQTKRNVGFREIEETNERIEFFKKRIEKAKCGVDITLSCPRDELKSYYEKGEFIVAYYKANRQFEAIIPKQIEKVELQTAYAIDAEPRQNLVKYLLDMKMTQALAITGGKNEKAQMIQKWFDEFEKLLQTIFGNPEVRLVFDEETFVFTIKEPGKETYDFNTLSSGYEAILDIVVDIMLRMEKKAEKKFLYDLPGIVLVDEIETHLHLELQKSVMKMLTVIFPNIQFIVTTHSPFVLNSLKNTTIFDLESKRLVTDGLEDVPYSGIVKGYFQMNELSEELKEKYEAYKILVSKQELTDEDFEKITELEMYLDEIPDYLALGITTEYKRLKLEFKNREDI